MDLGKELRRIWEDQAVFNRLLRKPPESTAEMMAQSREFVLYTESELHELLRTFQWKAHRRTNLVDIDNNAHREEECADIFKCVLSLFQVCGLTPESLIDAYWRKTAVVRHRYMEEWQLHLDRPCAIVDIDNVLCDYPAGMIEWMTANRALLEREGVLVDTASLDRILETREWVNARALGLTEEKWQKMKHLLRTNGGKRAMPIFPDARPFLEAIRRRGLSIVLLTSRPIDRYPNLYTDTLMWLNKNQLPFDFIWWATDKAERMLMRSEILTHTRFTVDDDARYANQFAELGLMSYCLKRSGMSAGTLMPLVIPALTLQQVIDHYDQSVRSQENEQWPTTPTPNIARTQST